MQLRNKFDCIDWRPWKRDETIEIIALLQKKIQLYIILLLRTSSLKWLCVCAYVVVYDG